MKIFATNCTRRCFFMTDCAKEYYKFFASRGRFLSHSARKCLHTEILIEIFSRSFIWLTTSLFEIQGSFHHNSNPGPLVFQTIPINIAVNECTKTIMLSNLMKFLMLMIRPLSVLIQMRTQVTLISTSLSWKNTVIHIVLKGQQLSGTRCGTLRIFISHGPTSVTNIKIPPIMMDLVFDHKLTRKWELVIYVHIEKFLPSIISAGLLLEQRTIAHWQQNAYRTKKLLK